ncbi:MAG: hypothetical protein MUD01_13100 [Chloroflexaceae bacterium]|nr:hypothetical protein [Chloroflexaceae bacterium]
MSKLPTADCQLHNDIFTMSFTFSPPHPHEDAVLDRVLAQSLHFAPGSIATWMERLGRENFRAFRRDG